MNILGEGGLVWFLRESYSFINPIGFWENLKFLVDLPGAIYRYSHGNKND